MAQPIIPGSLDQWLADQLTVANATEIIPAPSLQWEMDLNQLLMENTYLPENAASGSGSSWLGNTPLPPPAPESSHSNNLPLYFGNPSKYSHAPSW
jgi:hypothetical protein